MRSPGYFYIGILISSVASAQLTNPSDMRIGSESALWLRRSPLEKETYLEGLCTGLRSAPGLDYLIEITCKPISSPPHVFRFCGMLYSKPIDATKEFDRFYKEGNNSDIPNWAAVGAYNDRVCGENNVIHRMSKIQERRKCYRVLANIGDVVKEVRKRQQEHCDKLPPD